MSDISASSIKELREMTGAGMMDCKKALTETKGNMEEAVDWLRKKGLASAAKKSGRVAAEGLVAVASTGTTGAIIELNAETDFVARNDQFQALARSIAETALTYGDDVEKLKQAKDAKSGVQVSEQVAQLIGTIGENMNLRRSAKLQVSNGVVATYIHSATAPGLGKIGVLVALESTGDKAQLEALGKQIAMHIAAAKPEALTTKDVDASKLERERAVFKEQAMASGKPAEIADKMVEGRIRKYYEEVVLLEQVFVIDNKSKISQVVADAEKTVGAPVKLTAFTHFKLGEGIEKQETDFAAEVAAAAGTGAAA
ncbi:MAG TPA: translation elongation factor Ts [Rickettsiales bacterium]|nr:translation elongation factor Ts [Rickettsiales bacterium]